MPAGGDVGGHFRWVGGTRSRSSKVARTQPTRFHAFCVRIVSVASAL